MTPIPVSFRRWRPAWGVLLSFALQLNPVSGQSVERSEDVPVPVLFGAEPSPATARIVPLAGPVLAGQPAVFQAEHPEEAGTFAWDFGDGSGATGPRAEHVFAAPGIYRVALTVGADGCPVAGFALVRVHTAATRGIPQLLLDTDARNEIDDQHYIGYALFSELDVLGINSIHHGDRTGLGLQEAMNYGEIALVLEFARKSGLPVNRLPRVFHGARGRLTVPASGHWADTEPIVTEASNAILAAARGASPDNPVWVLPVGPCTNIASAILQARREGLELKNRLRICWLGGGPESAEKQTFNGRNDPWSVYVTGQSGLPVWVLLENPTGASLQLDTRTESDLYPDNVLGRYLRDRVRSWVLRRGRPKALYDPAAVALVLDQFRGGDWLTAVEPATIRGPEDGYAWAAAEATSPLRIVRAIDYEAMKRDIFSTLQGHPSLLR